MSKLLTTASSRTWRHSWRCSSAASSFLSLQAPVANNDHLQNTKQKLESKPPTFPNLSKPVFAPLSAGVLHSNVHPGATSEKQLHKRPWRRDPPPAAGIPPSRPHLAMLRCTLGQGSHHQPHGLHLPIHLKSVVTIGGSKPETASQILSCKKLNVCCWPLTSEDLSLGLKYL